MVLWLSTHWKDLLLGLLAVDQTLVGIFPTVAIFGSLAGWLKTIAAFFSPPAPPAA